MVPRDGFGVDLIVETTPDRQLRRRVDWVEPPAEGEYLLVCAPADDD